MSKQPQTKKSLGQHWLNDPDALESIALATKLEPSDTVLEIGPGPGALTRLLVKEVNKVVAVELDDNLAANLKKAVKADNLEVVHQDILSFDFNGLPTDYKLVANIPYYLTSNLIRRISETDNSPAVAVILIQKEVAQRVAAKPGDMSLLSVTAQFYWQVELGEVVPAYLFMPPPKVDSQVIILNRREKSLFDDVKTDKFFDLVRAGFAQRRKTLLNALTAGLKASPDEINTACTLAGIDPKRRAQTLSLSEWHQLYLAILDLLSI